MLFEACWFFIKSYQSNKKFTDHKDCYYVFFLNLTHFGPIFSVHWAYIETSQFILHVESSGRSCRIVAWGTLDFGGTLVQIGLMHLLVLFIYFTSKDVIKSWDVPDRQFLEYNHKFSYNKYHDNQFLELITR